MYGSGIVKRSWEKEFTKFAVKIEVEDEDGNIKKEEQEITKTKFDAIHSTEAVFHRITLTYKKLII